MVTSTKLEQEATWFQQGDVTVLSQVLYCKVTKNLPLTLPLH